jgi:hypothetical protein
MTQPTQPQPPPAHSTHGRTGRPDETIDSLCYFSFSHTDSLTFVCAPREGSAAMMSRFAKKDELFCGGDELERESGHMPPAPACRFVVGSNDQPLLHDCLFAMF